MNALLTGAISYLIENIASSAIGKGMDALSEQLSNITLLNADEQIQNYLYAHLSEYEYEKLDSFLAKECLYASAQADINCPISASQENSIIEQFYTAYPSLQCERKTLTPLLKHAINTAHRAVISQLSVNDRILYILAVNNQKNNQDALKKLEIKIDGISSMLSQEHPKLFSSDFCASDSTPVNPGQPIDLSLFRKELWHASQRDYLNSHNKGNRFYNLNIVERLLPQGYMTDTHFNSYGKTDDGQIVPVKQIYQEIDDNLSIIGEGGIGKTTFLQHLMENAFFETNGNPKAYMDSAPIFIFIELNRCPDHVENWYNNSLRKTNFITRYIGQILENHTSLDTVSSHKLDLLEKEMQRQPTNGKAQYILLLDGFNEVRADGSVRTNISNEISILSHYANVRIITTSRETQSAYYTSKFKNIRLIGVSDTDIFKHLHECGISDVTIGNVKECDSLLECLRIPLYLCMFTHKPGNDDFLPETAGEILYTFFHRRSAFYNTRKRLIETNTCRLNDQQISLVLSFIIPYIGWVYENEDSFYMNAQKFDDLIKDSLDSIKAIFCNSFSNPFADFEYTGQVLESVVDSLYINGTPDVASIISCIYDYLGIVYQYKINDGEFSNRIRYSFCHHQFRDYFSSIWDIQILSMLQSICQDSRYTLQCKSVIEANRFLDMRHWQLSKVRFISEILMEHRNRPYFDEHYSAWFLPNPQYDEQKVLTNALNYCRLLHSKQVKTKYFLQNILSCILLGRKEYSGLDLSELDLTNCHLFNVTCSRHGKNNTLAANFSGSVLTENSFVPENHLNYVIEYVYYENYCYTIDDSGIIKCWDVFSGKLEYELQSGNPMGTSDFSAKGYIRISPDGKWLIAKVQNTQNSSGIATIHIFDLINPTVPPMAFQPPMQHKRLTHFTFTQDSKHVLILCDSNTVYCINVSDQSIVYSSKFDLYKYSELYAENEMSNIYAYTAEYNAYEIEQLSTWFPNEELDDYEDDCEEDNCDSEEDCEEVNHDSEFHMNQGIACALCILNPNNNETIFLYHYISEPATSPAIAYLRENKSFVFYNYSKKCVEQFFCEERLCDTIVGVGDAINGQCPSAIHAHPKQTNRVFIVYSDVCFEADIVNGGHILMVYTASGIEKLLQNSDLSGELHFMPNVVPSSNRFIIANDSNTYEWDSKNDVLVLKYNTALFETTALFTSQNRDSFILVHEHNGISIFSGTPVKLERQYCFYEEGYQIGNSCYDPSNEILALSFARPDHEKIALLDLKSGRYQVILPAIHEGESFSSMCFSESGKHILITSQYRCVEHDISNGRNIVVCNSETNERLISGVYVNDQIEIAIVEHTTVASPRIDPYCIYYEKKKIGNSIRFVKSWYYVMPKLDKDLFAKFIYKQNDLGALGSLDENGIQQYWVTRGFFLESTAETIKILQPKCYSCCENHVNMVLTT